MATPKLSDDRKAAIFRSCATATLFDVGVQFELDKHYANPRSIRNKVYAIYREVANEPEKFSVHPDTVSLVVAAVSSRKVAPPNSDHKGYQSLAEQKDEKAVANLDIKTLTLDSRDTAGRLIQKKLAYIDKHPKALMNESLVNLGKIFGILFDKSQIIQGQATEHIAMMGKIDKDMSPEDALEAVLRSREVNSADYAK